MLLDFCKEQHYHCLCFQETHRGVRKARPRIHRMTPVAQRPHDKYGSAMFIIEDLKVKSISVTAANHVEVITAQLPDVVVHSVYKPPIEQFLLPPLGPGRLPQIVIGYLNSHITIWGYDATDNNGGIFHQHYSTYTLQTYHHQEHQFRSWPTQMTSPSHLRTSTNAAKKYIQPYLQKVFAWTKQNNLTLNPDKPTCTLFTVHILIDEVAPTPENIYYERCVDAICVTSRKHIPRWCRSHYIPGLSEESKSLYEAYKKHYMSTRRT